MGAGAAAGLSTGVGSCSQTELEECVKSMPAEQRNKVLEALDALGKDAPGAALATAAAAPAAATTGGTSRIAKVRALVKELDDNGDGLLSKAELAACFPADQIDEILKMFDITLKDGRVKCEAFLQLAMALEVEKDIQGELKKGKDGLPRPLIMAHRGACGYNPPHSLEGYFDAVAMGADYIEFDVISTKDHVLIMNHDVTICGETDVATKFPDRKTTCDILTAIDGDPLQMTGWFGKDFTLEEVKTLEKIESWAFRTVGKGKADKLVQRPLTVAEAAAALEEKRVSGGRNFGIIVELKRPSWHRDTLQLPIEEKLIEDMAAFKGPVCIQCFEPEPLIMMKPLKPEWSYCRLLVDRGTLKSVGSDVKHGVPDDPSEFEPFFKEIAAYSDWVSPWKGSVVKDPKNPPESSELINICHKLGMEVNCYTFRTDVKFLSQAYGGNASAEYALFFKLGVDAVFSDFSNHAKRARTMFALMSRESETVKKCLVCPRTAGLEERVSSRLRFGKNDGRVNDGLPRPLIMAHRGACGWNPPHSLEGYFDAVSMGADYIEFDVISTKDHVLMINHDVTIDGETDIATKFPDRKSTCDIPTAIDGDSLQMTGWFGKDFTLEEVKTLEKIEAWSFRTVGRAKADKLVQRPLTVTEAAAALEEKRVAGGRNFGIIVELKRPSWHRDALNLPIEEKLIEDLKAFNGPVCIQCFEPEPLIMMKALKPEWSYCRLLVDRGTLKSVGCDIKYGVPDLDSELEPFLKEIATYADWVSPWKGSLVKNPDCPPESVPFIDISHKLGMEVNCYTFRTDVNYLSMAYAGNATEEFALFFKLGVDAVFTDFSDHGKHARDVWTLLGQERPSAMDIMFLPNPYLTTRAHKTLKEERQIDFDSPDEKVLRAAEKLAAAAGI